MKVILVTGGAGFIGSNLIQKLIKQNKIICLDNFLTSSLNNIKHFTKLKNFQFIKQDIIKPIKIPKVDEIYHLACPASPPFYQKDPIHTLKTSFMGTLNVIHLALHCHARVVYASTSEVYGDPLVHPQKEDYWGNVNPNGVRSCYDEGKRVAEALLAAYWRTWKLDVRIVRIFNTYGEKMNPLDGRVVTNFIYQALKGIPITIYGTGKQTRSFCYVSDLVNGIIKLMHTKSFSPNELPLINLGNPKEITIKTLAQKVIKITKSNSQMIFKSLPLDDPKKRNPHIHLAEKRINWTPKITLEQGLRKTINYVKKKLLENNLF